MYLSPPFSLLHLKIRSRFKFPRPLQCSLSSSDEKCKNIQFLKRSDTVFTGGRQIFQIPTKSVNFCKRVHFAFHSGSGFGDGLPSWALCAAFSFTMGQNDQLYSCKLAIYVTYIGKSFLHQLWKSQNYCQLLLALTFEHGIDLTSVDWEFSQCHFQLKAVYGPSEMLNSQWSTSGENTFNFFSLRRSLTAIVW